MAGISDLMGYGADYSWKALGRGPGGEYLGSTPGDPYNTSAISDRHQPTDPYNQSAIADRHKAPPDPMSWGGMGRGPGGTSLDPGIDDPYNQSAIADRHLTEYTPNAGEEYPDDPYSWAGLGRTRSGGPAQPGTSSGLSGLMFGG